MRKPRPHLDEKEKMITTRAHNVFTATVVFSSECLKLDEWIGRQVPSCESSLGQAFFY